MGVAAVRATLQVLVAQLDTAAITPVEAEALVEEFAGVERLAQSGKVLCAGRAAEGGAWRRHGDRTPAEWLARRTKASKREADRLLETAKRLDEQPEVEWAMRRGELNADQATEISEAVAADPASAARLVKTAKRESLAGLRDATARTKAAARGDDAVRHERARRERHLRTRVDEEGVHRVEGSNTAAAGAIVEAALKTFRAVAFKAARASGRRESLEAYAADALEMMAAAALGIVPTCILRDFGQASPDPARRSGTVIPWDPVARGVKLPGGRVKVIARVDHTAIVRGATRPGETCDIVGLGPVPVAAIRALMATGDPFLAAVVTKGKDVMSVAHLGRQPTAYQRTALQWRDGHCVVEGCTNSFNEIDHNTGWVITRDTRTDDLALLCGHHHRLKTAGWHLEANRSGPRRRLLAPQHPDHPSRDGGPRARRATRRAGSGRSRSRSP
jgi:hypothetical protein